MFSSHNVEEHIQQVGAVLSRFIERGIKINPAKARWARSEVQYLGNVYNQAGSKLAPKLLDKIHHLPAPRDLTTPRQCPGMLNFCKGYIENFQYLSPDSP